MPFGSAIHKRSSYTHAPILSVKTPNASHQGVFVEGETYPKWAVPTNNVPESLEEPPFCSSSFFDLKIPLVSLIRSRSVLHVTGRGGKGLVNPLGTYRKSKMGSPVPVHPR